MKYYFTFIIISLGLLVVPHNTYANSLRVYLFNDNGNIRFDNMREPVEFRQGQDVFRDQFAQIESEYQIHLISANPEVPSIPIAVPNKESSFVIDTPWYSHLDSLEIRRNDQVIDTASLQSYNTCNGNSICEFERGENESTCLSDCVGSAPQYSSATQQTLASQNGVIRDEEGTVLLELREESDTSSSEEAPSTQSSSNFLPLIGGIVLIIGAVGYLVYTKVRKQ